MAAVSDSSPLVLLAKVGRFDLLRDLYGQLIVPDTVWREVAEAGGRPGAAELRAATWITRRAPTPSPTLTSLHLVLDVGEAEAVALALEIGSTALVVLDDRPA